MAKFFINGTPPKQTRSFIGQLVGLKVQKGTADSNFPTYSEKNPEIDTYMAVDPRMARLFKTREGSNVTQQITIGYDYTMTQYNGQRAEIGLDLDAIVNYFDNKDDTTSENLVFGYPIVNEDIIEISTSLMEAKMLTRRKNSDGDWEDMIDISNNQVVFSNNEDKKEIKIFYMVSKIAGLPDTYMININGETMQIMEDLRLDSGPHQCSPVYDSYTDHGIAGLLIGPVFSGANEHGNGVLSCPKNSFRIRPFQSGELTNIGIDTNQVTLTIKTNLNWQKLDNGDYDFSWKDSADMTPKYLSLQIQQNSETDFHESTRIAMNYTAHRE